MQLFHANRQWSTRPQDERFSSLESMHEACKAYADRAGEKMVPWSTLRVEASGDEVVLTGRGGVPAVPTYYAFGQLAQRIGAPANYLRSLPATLAAQNLNHGLKDKGEGEANLLFHNNATLVLRAVTSEKYARIWNHEVTSRLLDLSARHNLVPARATAGYGLQGEAANDDAALYASDHDMFAFLMDRNRSVRDPGGAAMFRGIIVANSEVGDCALKVMGFWFRDICSNHIIWGAEEIAEVRLSHIGQVRDRWITATARIRRYLDSGTSFESAAFQEVTRTIADTKDGVLDAIFQKRIPGLTRKALEASYDAVVTEEDGSPRTAWGMAQGVTRYAQTVGQYADERTDLDRAAGKLLSVKF